MGRAKKKTEGWVFIGLPCATCRRLRPLRAFEIEPGYFSYDCSKCRGLGGSANAEHRKQVLASVAEVEDLFIQRRESIVDQRKRTMAALVELARRQREGKDVMPETLAIALRKFPDRAAAILGKTFAVMGADAFDKGLADDQAVSMLLDLVNELDETLIPRNKNKSLARLKRAS